MISGDRYDTSGLVEAQYEPGSEGRVLRNLLGVVDPAEMARIETKALLHATEHALDEIEPDHVFIADDVCQLHKEWLSAIYPWAGTYRQVVMSKGGFAFAAPAHIPMLMAEYERDVLAHHTPCAGTTGEVASSLSIAHVELVLIHPFREGNGRLARLLSLLMGLQAGLPPLDFSMIDGAWRERYFEAVRAGMDRNYQPMAAIFEEVIRLSAQQVGE